LLNILSLRRWPWTCVGYRRRRRFSSAATKALFFIVERPLSLHRARPWDHHGRVKAMVPRETVSTDNDRRGYPS
jgi:hypothetical protein